MRKIIEYGYIYIAQPPLFKVQQGKKIEYAYNDQQLEEIMASYQLHLSLAYSVIKVLGK